jgi:hypothetical protein
VHIGGKRRGGFGFAAAGGVLRPDGTGGGPAYRRIIMGNRIVVAVLERAAAGRQAVPSWKG